MIQSSRSSWLKTLFVLRGTALRQIWRRLTVTTLVATLVTGLHHGDLGFSHGITIVPFSLIGLALSIFLGFRNNTSYDRFWEGRKLWGSLVNTSRSLTRQILTLVDAPERHRDLVYRVIAYVHALRLHLRDDVDDTDLRDLLPEDELRSLAMEKNRPVAVLQLMGDQFAQLFRQGAIHPMHLPSLDGSLSEMTNIQGGCERIKSTPIPFSYTVLIHRIVAVYCFALPFGLVDTVGVLTPVVVALVSYAFFGLDAVGEQIEEPFGLDPNDLPLTTLSKIIETNLRQRLGEQKLPKIPDDIVLT